MYLFKKLIVHVMLLWTIWSLPCNAQNKFYLSGQDAATAVNWQFKINEGRNSGSWTTIPVPSNWETQGFGYYMYGMDKIENRKSGVADYRHQFDFEPQEKKRYFIVFQGSMTDTTVVLNNKKIGFHQGGYTEFKFEVTGALRGGLNTLDVNVNSSSTDESIVRAERYADYWMFSGIFRPVFIEEVADEFVERVAIDAQMTGDFTMDVYTNGVNKADSVSAQIYDSKQNKVGNAFNALIASDKGKQKVQLKAKFTGIDLWSHEFPNLYSVKVELKSDDSILHSYDEKFGFRSFEVRDHDGFYLNGKRILLKGANAHSFNPETGRALSKADIEKSIKLMKELNFNFVRPSHYPPDSYFFELTDEYGLLALNELPGWVKPLSKDIGPKIVRELIVRDVNHPSIIMWSNGNHNAHVPEFDVDFARWDIQKRRPLKNASKDSNIFDKYNPDWDIVNTTYYPDYATAKRNLFEKNHIYLPNEVLHALYDGGGGANLKTYWDMFEASPVGGGMTIWALYDEGLMRNDMGYTVDNQGAKAADGILGPYGQKMGDSDTIREVWSPVVISDKNIDQHFNGRIAIHNKFDFANLNQTTIIWKLIDFANPDASSNGHRTVKSGTITVNLAAGETGELELNLPKSFITNDALMIEVHDMQNNLVYDKRLPITEPKNGFRLLSDQAYQQDKQDVFTFHRGDTTLRFDRNSGVLAEILDKDKATSLGNFPFLTFKALDDQLVNNTTHTSRAIVSKKGNSFVIKALNTKGFDYLTWTLKANGEIALDYAYTLAEGQYYYAGIGIEVAAGKVQRKRWLGEGPWRIYQNRKEGGILDVYAIDKKISSPGEIYNGPEFEGYFAPWNWAVFYLDNYLNVGFINRSDVTLGVLNPINAKDPKNSIWHYPEQQGFYLFDAISAVGSKWKDMKVFGPDAQPTLFNKQVKGTTSLLINWNKPDAKAKRVDMELE
ncbi:MAG: hypothetical protein NWQ54_07700 [Paraglaciecola sp.]|nr:hypothetical protein [Paraglaciecola sp.]